MEPDIPGEITLLLNRSGTPAEKCQRLAELVYGDLRQIATRVMISEPIDHTLQPTIVATDALMKLVDQPDKSWQSRKHFYAAAAKTMRQMMVDHGRKRRAQKRGGAFHKVDPMEVVDTKTVDAEDLLALDQALNRLERIDKVQLEIVELRYFGGLTEEETAAVLNLGLRTVKREWGFARLWLHAELTKPPSSGQVGKSASF